MQRAIRTKMRLKNRGGTVVLPERIELLESADKLLKNMFFSALV
jgi:hypothetical protein